MNSIFLKKFYTILLIIIFHCIFLNSYAGKFSVEGSPWKVIEISPEASTGINKIFVVRNISDCSITYKADDISGVHILRYSNLGGGYAEDVRDITFDGDYAIIEKPEGDMGYIVEDAGKQNAFWVVDYNNHVFTAHSLNPSIDTDCDYTRLNFDGTGGPINYFTITGQSKVLSREIYLDYTTQEFDSEAKDFFNTDVRKVYESISGLLLVSPPSYCSTFFKISGDRFLREWKAEISVESRVIEPIAVNCSTIAEQNFSFDDDEASNIIKNGDGSALGGSAPANISFYSFNTEGVIHYEWQMSRDPDFNNIEYRFNQKDLDYTFNEEGTFYMRYIGSNSEGTCETYGDIYTISIGASELKIPNAFSPNDDGINDIWKVSYRSLLDFHCEIFNRNGQKIYSFDSPDGGWDGTYHGKKVKSGVYYYVILATGADGKKYKKSGDINIIISKIKQNSGSSYED